MFRYLNKTLIVSAGIIFLSCAFADLRQIGISTVPDGPLSLLPDAESPVVIRFDTEMEKRSAENALQIYSPSGLIDGEFSWEGQNLNFIPASPWLPGVRYALKLSGTVTAADGRETLLATDMPFYAVSRSALPYVVSFSPPDGASVESAGTAGDTAASGFKILELNFSHPMDSRSTEDALKLDIPGKKIVEWFDAEKTMRVSSDEPLSSWTVYRWSISEKALSAEGAPLTKDFSGRFITDLSREFLSVKRLVPLMPPDLSVESPSRPEGGTLWGTWIPAGIALEEGLGFNQGIGVEFNKPVESGSLRRAFSFAPPLPGRVEILSPVSAVFIPSGEPEPETVYTMSVSASVKDTEGLQMGSDYTVTFKTDVPFLRINSLLFDSGEKINNPASGDIFPVKVDTGGIVRCSFDFSLPIDFENHELREECAMKISLRPFFPASLTSVSLRSARWTSLSELRMEWEGLSPGIDGEAHYYKLLIPGGRNGVHNGGGSGLKEDFILYLEAGE